jgi:hypothetical protein
VFIQTVCAVNERTDGCAGNACRPGSAIRGQNRLPAPRSPRASESRCEPRLPRPLSSDAIVSIGKQNDSRRITGCGCRLVTLDDNRRAEARQLWEELSHSHQSETWEGTASALVDDRQRIGRRCLAGYEMFAPLCSLVDAQRPLALHVGHQPAPPLSLRRGASQSEGRHGLAHQGTAARRDMLSDSGPATGIGKR